VDGGGVKRLTRGSTERPDNAVAAGERRWRAKDAGGANAATMEAEASIAAAISSVAFGMAADWFTGVELRANLKSISHICHNSSRWHLCGSGLKKSSICP